MKKIIFLLTGIAIMGAGCVQQQATVEQLKPSSSTTQPVQAATTTEKSVNKNNENFSFQVPNNWTETKDVQTDTAGAQTISYSLTYKLNPKILITVNSPIPGMDYFGYQSVETRTLVASDNKTKLDYQLFRQCLDVDEKTMDCIGGKTAKTGGSIWVTWNNSSQNQGIIIGQLNDGQGGAISAAEEKVVKDAVQYIINTLTFSDTK